MMHKILIAVSLALLLGSCDSEPAADWRFGVNLSGLAFEIFDDSEGIHPSRAVLDDPNNPFRDTWIGEETKWDILAEGGNAGAFYAWATLLARTPTGEHQFYAAQKLAHVYAANEAPDDQQDLVRLMAIAGYQAVLDHFPDSVTYDPTGTIPFRLATPAYLGIVDLGGRPEGGWVLVTTPEGGVEAVQGGDDPTPDDGETP